MLNDQGFYVGMTWRGQRLAKTRRSSSNERRGEGIKARQGVDAVLHGDKCNTGYLLELPAIFE
jgi:hypothetical protein